jgi:hypothetical protein
MRTGGKFRPETMKTLPMGWTVIRRRLITSLPGFRDFPNDYQTAGKFEVPIVCIYFWKGMALFVGGQQLSLSAMIRTSTPS